MNEKIEGIHEEEIVSVLADAHGEPEPVEVNGIAIPGCYRVSNGHVLLDGRVRRMLNNGWMLVSDAASQAVASKILPQDKINSLLEIGAGRGTKTVLLQSNAVRTWGSQIDNYVALDNHEFKNKILVERAEQFGVKVADAVCADATV